MLGLGEKVTAERLRALPAADILSAAARLPDAHSEYFPAGVIDGLGYAGAAVATAVSDCLGICKYHTVFLGATLPNFEDWPKVLYLNTGLELTPTDIWSIAERCNMIERLFNLREGLTRNDLKKGDTLNHRYFDEPTLKGAPGVVGRAIDRDKFAQMVDELYGHKGLDSDGIPKPETLKRLDLENEPSQQL